MHSYWWCSWTHSLTCSLWRHSHIVSCELYDGSMGMLGISLGDVCESMRILASNYRLNSAKIKYLRTGQDRLQYNLH